MTALITISTRASLKKYHTFNLVLGMGAQGDEWAFERIGTEQEKMQVERELLELTERLALVEEWKKRRDEIEQELAAVWMDKGEALDGPDYVGAVEGGPEEPAEAKGKQVEADEASEVLVESEAGEAADEAAAEDEAGEAGEAGEARGSGGG